VPTAIAAASSTQPQGTVPTVDLAPCLRRASPQWKLVGVTLDLAWDRTAMTLAKCTPVDLSASASSTAGSCGALTGPFPGAPGWEVQGPTTGALCRRTWDGSSQSLTCKYLTAAPPPPGHGGASFTPLAGAPTAGTGGTYSSIPILPGATTLVVYDNPCGGARDPHAPFANQPLARFTLR
jgi:hypothetical protein